MKSADQRLNDLETTLGLLQRDFDDQNEMLLHDAKQIKDLQRTVERLEAELAALKFDDGPESLEDQVPPHY